MYRIFFALFIFIGLVIPSIYAQDSMALKTLTAINKARRSTCACGSEGFFQSAPSLTWNDKLAKAAIDIAIDNSKRHRLSHVGIDSSTLGTRAKRYDYTYTAIGENLARGLYTPQEVVERWLNSPNHCRNIMNQVYVEIGIAEYNGVWAMVIGTPFQSIRQR